MESPGTQLKLHLWNERWPAHLAVPGLIPASDENLRNRKRGSLAHGISLLPFCRPDLTEILFKRTYNGKSYIHSSLQVAFKQIEIW